MFKGLLLPPYLVWAVCARFATFDRNLYDYIFGPQHT